MSVVDLLMRREARISECGAYRYTLSRKWSTDFYPMVFVMMNPSTADAEVDDPTIRRCIGFAQREHLNAIMVVNLFAFRATSPKDMLAAADPIGPENDDLLASVFFNAAMRGAPIVAAWGVHGAHKKRDRAVLRIAQSQGAKLQCLGVTKGGHPKHPLYLASDAALAEWCPTPPDGSGDTKS